MPCTTKLIGQSTEGMCPPFLVPLQSLQKWPTDSCTQFPLLSPLFLPFTSPPIPQIPQFDPTIPPPPLPSKLEFPGPSPTPTKASNRQSTDIYSQQRIFPYFPNIQSATKYSSAEVARENSSARPQFPTLSFSPFTNFTSQTSASMKMKMKVSTIPQTFDPTIRPPPPSLPNKPLKTTADNMDEGLFLISS